MKKISCHLFLPMMICCLTVLPGCHEDPPLPPPIPITRDSLIGNLRATIAFLKETGRYTIGEHTCMLEIPGDSYDYSADTTDTKTVPPEVLGSMSTPGLVQTILESPHFRDGGPSFAEVMGLLDLLAPELLEELYSRDDAAGAVIDRYLGMYYTCLDNNYSSRPRDSTGIIPYNQVSLAFQKIQMLIAQYPLIEGATNEEIDSLSAHVIKTAIMGTSVDYSSFSIYCLPSAVWLAARIMYSEGYQPFIDVMPLLDSSYPTAIMDGYRDSYWCLPSSQTRFLLLLNDFIESRHE